MTVMSPNTAVTRLTLLPTAPRTRGADEPKIRRYRLAAVRPERAAREADRFGHLKRAYD
ncbi:hypothetical protein DSM112329_02350 [Paraconexibacter sp. AEG42_29]|uniref:J domain-containing protein n=2 Tax=Paraconexibacter sp. AEG42_29 TaxID=2997339 RepID=A0AAU7AV50_9ACTN